MKRTYQILFIPLLSFLIFSCGEKYDGKSEGELHYKITYPKMDHDNFMRDFMPKQVIMKFKNDKSVVNLAAGMGMFQMAVINDPDDNTVIQTTKLINKKYMLTQDADEVEKSLKNMPTFTIEYTGEVKNILGFNCEEAIISVNDGSGDAYSVFYTDQINIESSNWFNQYAPIKGLLLEYQYEKYGICMRFTATKLHYKQIDDDVFDIPDGYAEISEIEMNKEMTEIFESFN